MNGMVDRFGRTGFAALCSLIWALPMAAWAGSADLSPIDKTAYPWIALGIGLVMLVVWIVLLTRLARIPVSTRQRRFDIGQMSSPERIWILAAAAFATGLIAWLNAAATVDWGPLGSAVGAAVTGQRQLESFEFRPLITFGTALLLLAALGFWKPHLVFWPIGGVLAALGLQLVVRGIQARFPRRRRRTNPS